MIRKRETVCGVLIYCDIKADESYTPSKFDIMCGNELNDLRCIKQVSVEGNVLIKFILIDSLG